MELLFSALADRERLEVLVWLFAHGPARQVEIVRELSRRRQVDVNPGEVSRLVRPLLEMGVLRRNRPRDPIEIAEPEHLTRLLQQASALSTQLAKAQSGQALREARGLQRALMRALPDVKEDK